MVRGADGARKRVGLSQGNPYAPAAMNLFMDYVLRHNAPDTNDPPRLVYSDNIAYMSRSVPEGRFARDRCQQLLQRHGLTLKGGQNEDESGEEPITDLKAGETTQLLGFALGHTDGRMTFGIGIDSWESLRRSLNECHMVHNPSRAAQSAIIGWVRAVAPAFENQQENDLVSRVLDTGREMGFREINPESIYRACDTSRRNWGQLTRKIREEYTRRLERVVYHSRCHRARFVLDPPTGGRWTATAPFFPK